MTVLAIQEKTEFYPAAAALEVTLRCNMRCIHCGSNATSKPRQRELTLDEWKGVVDQLVLLGCEFVALSGGEPFIYPHWRELASYVCQKGPALSMISNGYSIADDDVAFLKDLGMYNVALSVDGLEKAHNQIRQASSSFERAIDAIRRFKDASIKVAVSTSVNKLNFADLEELKIFLGGLGVDTWQLQIVNSFGRAGEMKDNLLISPSQYIELVNFIHQSQLEEQKVKMKIVPADSVGYCVGIANEIWGDTEWYGCNAGRYVVGIQSNGNVTGCLSLQNENFIAGNVLNRSLKEIWDDKESFGYNRNMTVSDLKGPCKGCSYGAQCRSGCLGIGYSVSGKLYNNPYCYKYITESGVHV